MNLITAFGCYGISFLIAIVLPVLLLIRANKKGHKVKVLHLIGGFIVFIISFFGYSLLIRDHLSSPDGITDYFNTPVYRVTMIALVTIALTFLLWLLGMLTYMRRQSYKNCISFFSGFGSGGCIFVGTYAIFMLISLAIQCFSSSFLYFDKEVQAFYFSDQTYFSVFLPMSGHISFAITAFCFLIIFVLFAKLMCRITAVKLSTRIKILSFVLMLLSILVMLVTLCLMTTFSCPHYVLAIICTLCVGVSLLAVYLTYRFTELNDSTYEKQFE